MLRRTGLQGKLLFLCGILSLVTVAIGLTEFTSLTRVNSRQHHVASNNLPHLRAAGEIFRKFQELRVDMLSLVVPGLSDSDAATIVSHMGKSIETYDQNIAQYLKAEYSPGVQFGPDEKELFDAVATEWKTFKHVAESTIEQFRPDSTGKQKFALNALAENAKSTNVLNAAMRKLVAYNDEETRKWVDDTQTAAAKGNLLGLAIALIGSVMTMTVGFFVARNITLAVKKLSQDLSRGAETVASAADQITSASTAQSSSATEQAAALQETVVSLEEVSAMVGKNAENAKRSKKASADSQEAAQRGNQVVGEMIRSIQEISESNSQIMNQVETSNHEISQIVKVIAEISDKTKVINDIVFQTKLLSFNASVEAARAGEHGKGFAVVAEEVGKLAQMSGNASKEISMLLDSSVQKVESTVNQTKTKVEALIRSGKEKIDAGSSTAKRCGEVIEEILSNVSSVSEMISEIAIASDEQAAGVSGINITMNEIDHVTQQNANLAQQTADAAGKLTDEAQSFRITVSHLFAMVDGVGRDEPVAPEHHAPRKKEIPSKPSGDTTNVIEMKKRQSKTASLKSKHKDSMNHSAQLKKAAGGKNSVPSGDDPRFEDV